MLALSSKKMQVPVPNKPHPGQKLTRLTFEDGAELEDAESADAEVLPQRHLHEEHGYAGEHERQQVRDQERTCNQHLKNLITESSGTENNLHLSVSLQTKYILHKENIGEFQQTETQT